LKNNKKSTLLVCLKSTQVTMKYFVNIFYFYPKWEDAMQCEST